LQESLVGHNNKFTGFLIALGLFSLASGTAAAGIIDFSFTNQGSVTGMPVSCGGNCVRVATTGTATETGGTAGASSWTFNGVMEFSSTGWFGLEGNGTGTGLGWSFTDIAGNDNLYGSFSSALTNLAGLFTVGTVDYVISGGSGMFSGATGYGASDISFTFGQFAENGWMHVVADVVADATTPVPEPGITALLLAGLGMLAFMAYRRRRPHLQI
jgi:hypothetical protein